jgi:hypothetical protein
MRTLLYILPLVLISIWACDNDNSTNPGASNGRLNLYLTDAAAVYDSVVIHFTHISAHIDSEWVTIQGEPQSVNLLEWSNGRTLLLGSADVPAGKYTQIRVIIDSAKIGVDGEVYPLEVPSGAKTGLKFGPQFTIADGSTYELVMDFDAYRSVVVMGPKKNPNGYKLKPRIRLIARAVSGSISGVITNPEDAPEAFAIQGDDTVTSSLADTISGQFILGFLPEGLYKVSVEDTLGLKFSQDGVTVISGQDNDIGDISLN